MIVLLVSFFLVVGGLWGSGSRKSEPNDRANVQEHLLICKANLTCERLCCTGILFFVTTRSSQARSDSFFTKGIGFHLNCMFFQSSNNGRVLIYCSSKEQLFSLKDFQYINLNDRETQFTA